MVHKLTKQEQELLNGWEEVYKRGQLTLWIMLSLQHSPKHMSDIKTFIETETHGVVTADDQSMYRALRRYYQTELVTFINEPVTNGPDRKVYSLTDTGAHILQEFIERNIMQLLNQSTIKKLMETHHEQ